MHGNDTATLESPRRFLTDDDEVTFRAKGGKPIAYRLRFWQAQRATPVILATTRSHKIDATVGVLSDRIANYAMRVLAYPASGLLYFESSPSFGFGPPASLYHLHFDHIGRDDRMYLINPARQDFNWERLESIVGEPVER